jgi:2-oxoglutarate ferredoxin oxidoreductase subunit delta
MGEKKVKVKIDFERCKGCLFCMEYCKQGALKPSKSVNKKGLRCIEMVYPEKCSGCGICFLMCPDAAIEIIND